MVFDTYNKYGNRKTVMDGITFDSKKEAHRYWELKQLIKAKQISDLHLQVDFIVLHKGGDRYGNNFRDIHYIADFVYWDNQKGHRIAEDSKGMKTEVYKLKKKLFMWAYPEIELIET